MWKVKTFSFSPFYANQVLSLDSSHPRAAFRTHAVLLDTVTPELVLPDPTSVWQEADERPAVCRAASKGNQG